MKLMPIARRNIFRNTRRSALSGVAIAVAAFAIVFLFSIIEGMQVDMATNIQNFDTGEIRIQHVDYERNQLINPVHLTVDNVDELLARLDARDDVAAAVPRAQFPAVYFNDDVQKPVQIMAVDVARERAFMAIDTFVTAGTLPEAGSSGVAIGGALADELGLGIGDRLTVTFTRADRRPNALTFEIVGIANFPIAGLNGMTLLADYERVARPMAMEGSATRVLVSVPPRTDPEEVAAALAPIVAEVSGESIGATAWTNIDTTYSLIRFAAAIYNVIAAFFFVLGSTVIITTTIMVIFERVREIGTVTAMGMYGKEVVRLFFLEAFQIGVAGSAAGVILGIIVTAITARFGIDLSAALEGMDFEISGVLYPVLNLKSTVVVFFYSVIVSSLVTLWPSRRAARVEPVEALRSLT